MAARGAGPMAEHCTTIRVRYADTDAGGVVYHANYIVWLEAARTECLRAHNVPYTELQAVGVHLPVVDLGVRYRRPVLYDQLIEVWVSIQELGRARVHFTYRLHLAGDSKPLATAYTVHAVTDWQGRVLRLDRYPDLWRKILSASTALSRPGA